MIKKMLRGFEDLFSHWNQPRWSLPLYGVFLMAGDLFAFFAVFKSQSESVRAFLFGYSLERVLLGAALLVLFGIFFALTFYGFKRPDRSLFLRERVLESKIANQILWASLFAALLSWVALFLPSYRTPEKLFSYLAQAQPVIVWVFVVSAATALIFLYRRASFASIFADRTLTRMAWLVFAAFVFAGAIVIFTGIGIRQREDYWYGAGVPVIGTQVIFSLLAGVLFAWIESRRKIKDIRQLDALVFIVIWVAAAWLWASEPLQPNYFLPDTARNHLYPYSDSATYDLGSQFALIGQGLFNGRYFDRVLYSAFLTYLRAFVGQDTADLMTAQAIVYAVFPAIIYLLGKELHSRALGISAAALILLRGINAIVIAPWVDLSSPKMMLTDFPTAIGVALMILFILKWIKTPSSVHWAVWAGGALGMTLMLRTHVLMLIPFLFAHMLVSAFPRWKYWALAAALFMLGMFAATTPWDIRNLRNNVPMFSVYYSRIERILEARYGIDRDTYIPPDSTIVSGEPPRSASGQLASQDLTRRRITAKPAATRICSGRACEITNHFFHNLVTSVVFLPSSFMLDDLWNVVKNNAPYWEQDWTGGEVSAAEFIFFLLNLALISLGIAAAFARQKIMGLLPVVVFFAYAAANAFALTSGGRYIAPMDWITCLYYMLGVLQISSWGLSALGVAFSAYLPNAEQPASPSNIVYAKIARALVTMLLVGYLIPAAEIPFETRYEKTAPRELLVALEQQGRLEQTGLTRRALSDFLSKPQARLLEGRALYPRYFPAGKGEPKETYPYLKLDYPRLAFTLISPYGVGLDYAIVRGKHPAVALHAADVIMIGCKTGGFLDAIVVFVMSEPDVFYLRSPLPALKCPLQSP